MEDLVVDASVVAATLVDEPATEEAERALEAATRRGMQVHAPDLLVYEIASALAKRIARDEIAPAAALEALSDVLESEISLHPGSGLAKSALSLAAAHGLTAYDSSYLALAIALGTQLLTLDRELERRGSAAGIAVVEPAGLSLDQRAGQQRN
ncbi:MAG: type II toxin-antitoxin system VapC family toxin [Solirubrobacterales bacterium]